MDAGFKVIDKEKYYRHGVFRHFTEDCKCSTSVTSRIDVSALADFFQTQRNEILYQFSVHPVEST